MWEHFESRRDGTPRNIPFGICTTGLQKQESHDVNGTGISVVASEATNGQEQTIQRTAQCPIRGMTRPARGLGTRIDERNPEKLRA